MLTDLTIRNLALIEEARLGFSDGLNAITGETGAGKSLLVTGLELLSGGRLRRGSATSWVRDGAERAEVEGRFVLEDPRTVARVRACLERELPAFVPEWEDGDAELLLARAVEAGGRSRAWINHRPVTRRALESVAASLFEIHGQNSHQRLLEVEHQVELIDAFASASGLRGDYATARRAWRRAERACVEHRATEAERRERLEMLRHRCDELSAFEPTSEEPGELRRERQRLRHGADLARETAAWLDALSEGECAASDRLRSVEREVDRWVARVESLEGARAEVEQARVHLDEAIATLLSFSEDLELDPRRLEWIEGRLAGYERLARVHGVETEQLAQVFERLQGELDRITETDGGLEALERVREAALVELEDAAAALTEARRGSADALVEAIQAILASLGLKRARLQLAFGPAADDPEHRYGTLGRESVELCLAANPGEPFRPLREVASGGETARLVLALRSALAGWDDPRVLVFDEIDTGVGGRLGPALGRHLRRLGEHHQVLTVTHLPAIAAAAHRHQVVRKAVRRGRTRTAIALLEGDDRVLEVAEMIAGGGKTETARAEARRLLSAAAG